MATENPRYEQLEKYDDFEVRRYSPRVVAQTEVGGARLEASSAAFGLLAGYIFGANVTSGKIAMTSPVTQAEVVTQTRAEARWVVEFSMPARFTLETLPAPNDSRVTLRAVPSSVVAVRRYSGTWSQESYDQNLSALRAALTREGLVSVGEPTWARYDPPWTPGFLRTNELHLRLTTPPTPAS
jgi:hypothetical protein